MGVLKQLQAQKKLNRKEQKLYDALIKCSGIFHNSCKVRYEHDVYLPGVGLWDNELERHPILFEMLYDYGKYVVKKKLDVRKYEREYNIKKVKVESWSNPEWNYEDWGLDEEVEKGNKIAIDIQNTINWLKKEVEEDLESRDIVLALIKYGLF